MNKNMFNLVIVLLFYLSSKFPFLILNLNFPPLKNSKYFFDFSTYFASFFFFLNAGSDGACIKCTMLCNIADVRNLAGHEKSSAE